MTRPPSMEAYYRYLLAGQGRATALREVMSELRRTAMKWGRGFVAGVSSSPLRT